MSKNNKNNTSTKLSAGLVPKLRFPDFQNDGEWGNTPLEELCEVITKGTTPTTLGFNYTEKGINFIKIESIQNGRINLSKVAFISNECNEALKRSQLKENDILFSIAGALGVVAPVSINELPANTNQALSIVRLKKGQNKDYILAYLSSNHISVEISKIKAGAAQPNISLSQVSNFNILLPKKPLEQKKVAECLLSLDEIITAESQKLEMLKDHKKGLLQNLLPQAGETVPKFRFKEFEDSGEWEETTLTQVADYENGKAHEQDIADDGEFIVVNSKFISQDGEVKKFTNTAFLPATKGDVLMVLSDIPNGRAIAKCFLVEEDNRYTVNQRICRITPRNVNSKILYYLLNRNPYFLAFDDGVKQTNLRKEDVLNCPLLIPEDPKEQEKIADTLSSIDDLIIAQNQKLEALQQHKKGLLQGLFPIVNEVTE